MVSLVRFFLKLKISIRSPLPRQLNNVFPRRGIAITYSFVANGCHGKRPGVEFRKTCLV
jgi:hypothetical protein